MKNAFSLVLIFLTWVSIASIASAWIGYWNLFPIPILVLSLLFSVWIWQRYGFLLETPLPAVLLFVAMLVLVAYPLVLVHPFFPASSDALHVTHIRILQDRIPETYAPYAGLEFNYQIGFALFSNAVAEILFFLPDYLVVWLLGVVFSGIVVLLTYWLVFHWTKSEKAGLASATLVIGTKFVFQNFYYGVFPLLASFALFLAIWLLWERKNPLVFLLIPTIILFHPFSGLLTLFFLAWQVLAKKDWQRGLWVLLSALLALPSLLTTYLNMFGNASQQALSFNSANFWRVLTPIPIWLGLVPLALFLLTLFLKKDRENNFVLHFGIAVFLMYLFFSGINFLHADKFFFFFTIAIVLFAGFFFVSDFWRRLEKRWQASSRFSLVLLLLFLLCLASFFLSSDLQRARSGSKATVEEEQFALAFKQFDPGLKKTIFLAKGGGWISLLSDKISFDPRANILIQSSELQFSSGWREVMARTELQKRIENGCISCIADANAYYLVVDQTLFAQRFDFKKVFEYGSFAVYQLNG